MPTGERGFTYLWLLFVLALGGAALAAAGSAWKTQAERERERELLFRGGEIARAITAYRNSPMAAAPQWPASLQDLLDDRRGGVTRRHLRRLYADPFTGQVDWLLVEAAPGQLQGVRSRSQALALMTQEFGPPQEGGGAVRVSDRVFMANPNVAPGPPTGASAPPT